MAALDGVFRARPRYVRPRGILGVGWACVESAIAGRAEHRPTREYFDDQVVRRVHFQAGGDLGWSISALVTPRAKPARWKIVVITGAPSWAEYWAPIMAALPPDREMVAVDRPGYGQSEPAECVADIRVQALALAPLLAGPPEQRILLVGQSYGAAIATLMAAAAPGRVAALVLLSSYLGESGPTARWLVDAGSRLKSVIPRDLRTAVIEVSGQPDQLPMMREALEDLRIPIHIIHGEVDDFAPVELARRMASEVATRAPIRFEAVPGANHFLTDGPVESLIGRLDACLPAPVSARARIGGWVRGLARLRPSSR